MPFLLILAAGLWWFEIWPFDGTIWNRYTYRPEVGYWSGGERTWYVGDDFNKREDCVSSATSTFKSYNSQSTNRAFSWACRKMDSSGNFLERVR